MAAVDCEHVSKTYAGGVRALDDCSLRVEDAELVVLVGPSGCGKSTLLRVIAGLEQASSGMIRIDGRVANDLSPQQRNVAMVFQDYALYPHMTVRRNLEYPLRMRRTDRAEMADRVAWVAGLLGIESLLERLPRELSGGQRQRVAMGRALVRKPAVSLLDEPLSNLDAKLRVQVRAEIAELQRSTATTMIYVTHDQAEAMTLGHRVVVLDRGVIRQIAPPREIYEHPADTFVAGFIGSPPMNLFATVLASEDGAPTFTIGDERVRLDAGFSERLAGVSSRAATAGIRPEHLTLTPGEEHGARGSDAGNANTAGCVDGTVVHVENLGHETLTKISIGGVALVSRLAGMPALAAGDSVRVHLDPGSLALFDHDGHTIT